MASPLCSFLVFLSGKPEVGAEVHLCITEPWEKCGKLRQVGPGLELAQWGEGWVLGPV